MTSYVLNTADAAALQAATPINQGPSFWQRFYAAMIESRRRSALRELRSRSFMIHEAEMVLGGYPQATAQDDSALPFNR